MVFFFAINWYDLFTPTHTLEIILRGSVTYLSIFLLMRFGLKRESGSIGTADLLMVVMIADAAQNAMAGEYKSITDGLILVGTILFWNHSLIGSVSIRPSCVAFSNQNHCC
jgi:uncharacterized membrane protein YcaP (DUF421 family)